MTRKCDDNKKKSTQELKMGIPSKPAKFVYYTIRNKLKNGLRIKTGKKRKGSVDIMNKFTRLSTAERERRNRSNSFKIKSIHNRTIR